MCEQAWPIRAAPFRIRVSVSSYVSFAKHGCQKFKLWRSRPLVSSPSVFAAICCGLNKCQKTGLPIDDATQPALDLFTGKLTRSLALRLLARRGRRVGWRCTELSKSQMKAAAASAETVCGACSWHKYTRLLESTRPNKYTQQNTHATAFLNPPGLSCVYFFGWVSTSGEKCCWQCRSSGRQEGTGFDSESLAWVLG